MDQYVAKIVTDVSLEAVKYLFKHLAPRNVTFLIPDYFKYPIVPGLYHQNPIAYKEGFVFHLINNTKSPIMLSFFLFKAYWKSGSKKASTSLDPKYYLKTIDAIVPGRIAKVTLPWKPVVLSCLYASYLKETNNADFFHIRINAYDDYSHSFYESERLSDFFIRSHALWNIHDLWETITDDELERVGWRREGDRWVMRRQQPRFIVH